MAEFGDHAVAKRAGFRKGDILIDFDGRDLAWVGITGVTLRGRIRLRDGAQGQTKVTFRLSYQAPGGILGYIADRVAVRQVGRNLFETLKCLKRLVES